MKTAGTLYISSSNIRCIPAACSIAIWTGYRDLDFNIPATPSGGSICPSTAGGIERPPLPCIKTDRTCCFRSCNHPLCINNRVDKIVKSGLTEEVSGLLAMGLTEDDISMKGIGYKEMIGYLNGRYDKDEVP